VFELHDIKQTGPLEATTRWTMTMKVCDGRGAGVEGVCKQLELQVKKTSKSKASQTAKCVWEGGI
jgi:hypothetical protein